MRYTYPRVYRCGFAKLAFYVSLALICAGMGGVMIFAGFTGWQIDHPVIWLPPVGAIFVLGFLYLIILPFRHKVVLYEDCITIRDIIKHRKIDKSDIVELIGVRNTYGILELGLQLRSKRKPVTIAMLGRADDVFTAWFNNIPYAVEETAAQQVVYDRFMANPAFGSNPTERAKAIEDDARHLDLLRWPVYGLTMWGMVYPRPYDWCMVILLTLPVLAGLAVMASHGRWTLNNDKTSGRIGIGEIAALGPSIVVGLRGFLDDSQVDIWPSVATAFVCAVALYLAVSLIERRFHWQTFAVAIIAYFAYAWGALLYANTILDNSPAHIYPVEVREVSGDKYSELTVTHWGGQPDDSKVTVTRSFAFHTKPGDTVCIHVHSGKLGWPWYWVSRCPAHRTS